MHALLLKSNVRTAIRFVQITSKGLLSVITRYLLELLLLKVITIVKPS